MPAKAYAYIRFSTPDQIKGDSLRRQMEASKKWAEEHGYEIDMYFQDLGVSGFSGDNRSSGDLKKFLDMVRDDLIDEGSVLILESLDRLSREELSTALILFLSVLSAGIKIVTLVDGKEYTSSSINDFGNLITPQLTMVRAHDESAHKSMRVRESLEARIANAHNKKISGHCPNWLRYNKDDDEFVVIEDRAQLIREIFRKAISGIGMPRIAHELNENEVPPWGKTKGWTASYLQVVFKSRSLLGEYQPHTYRNGKKEPYGDPIIGYYPAVLTEDMFYAAQTAIAQRKTKRGRRGKAFSNLLQGMCYCLECGSTMRYLKRGAYQYLLCSNAFSKQGCSNHKYFPYQKIETLMLQKVANKVDWYSVVAGVQTNLGELKRKQASLVARLKDTKKRIARYAEMFETAEDEDMAIAKERYQALNRDHTEIKVELDSVEAAIEAQTFPDADAIKAKMDHAIARLRRNETDPHELFELRATINSSLSDNVRLIFGGHHNNEIALGYVISGEKPQTLAYGDRHFEAITKIAAEAEVEHVIGGLQEMLVHHDNALGKAYKEMEELLEGILNPNGTGTIKIPSISRQNQLLDDG